MRAAAGTVNLKGMTKCSCGQTHGNEPTGKYRYMVTLSTGIERVVHADNEAAAKRRAKQLSGLRAVKAEEF